MYNIQKFSIENFKSFGPKEGLPLSKINFLFGPNSHGKSTALSALYILGNNLLQRDFSLSKISHIDNSPDIILRDDLVNYKSGSDTFKISCELLVDDTYTRNFGESNDELILIPVFELEDMNSGKLKSFSVYEKFNGQEALFLEITDDYVIFNYDSNYYLDSIRELNHDDKVIKEGTPKGKGIHKYEELPINMSIPGIHLLSFFQRDNLPEEFKELEEDGIEISVTDLSRKKMEIILFLNKQIDNIFESFELGWLNHHFGWVGPNRSVQNNSFTIGNEKGFIDDRFLTPDSVNAMNEWLRKTKSISLDYEFDLEVGITKAGLIKKEYGLKDLSTGKYLTLYEVGSGVAHIFQILLPFFSDIYGVIIQQPEIHLHPSLQVQLTKALIELSSELEIWPKIIIETHSEHIIKTAQLEIAKNLNLEKPNFKKEDLSVLYISKDEKGYSKVKKMELDETGAFTEPWPDDFFELSADLTMERLRNSFRGRN